MMSLIGSLCLLWSVAVNGQGIIRCPNECDHNPCGCCEDNMFDRCPSQCHANGCDDCDIGFKQSYGHECELCQDIFGSACTFCQDFNGCGSCKSGYNKVRDSQSGLYYCEQSSNPAPVANCQHTSSKPHQGRNIFKDPSCEDCDGEFKCPTDYGSKCSKSTCDCNELDMSTCSFCNNGAGCGQCKSGYFKQSNGHQCVSCKETFGNSCTKCTDNTGCQECAKGSYRTYSESCGLYFCATEEGCGPNQQKPIETSLPTPLPVEPIIITFTDAPTNYPTEEEIETPSPTGPTPAPTLPTPEPTEPEPIIPPPDFTQECAAYGDPHLMTWDGTGYHFQGEGYFDYVIPCIDSDINLPFEIAAKHVYCAKPYTCVGETIVSIDDGNIITIPSHGDDITPRFTDDMTSAIGNYNFYDDNGNKVYYSVAETVIEFTYIYDNEWASMQVYYAHDIIRIKTTDSMIGNNNLCGLCGTLDRNSTNDFTRCDTMEIIDNTGVSNVLIMNNSAYDRTNTFGESCCNEQFDMEYLGITNCITLTPAPTMDNRPCFIKAKPYCEETYTTYCYDCYNNTKVDEPKFINEWISGCVIDFCARDRCNKLALQDNYNFRNAIKDGCVNSVVRECIVEKYMAFSDRFQFC